MAGTREMLTALYDCPYIYERKLKYSHYKVRRPCLSILAATTLEWFCEAITETDLHGGLLPRFLYIPSKAIMPFKAYPERADEKKFNYLVNTLVNIYESADGELEFSEDAKAFFIDWSTDNDDTALALPDGLRLASFFHRLQSVFVKIAMILRKQKVKSDNIIDLDTAWQASKITNYFRDAATYMVREQMTFTTDQAKRKKILNLIEEAGEEGIIRSKLTRYANMRVRELAEYIEWLAQEGTIEIINLKKNQFRYKVK